jgi:RimJ/RimL family protein N-acetyltransferase
VIFVALRQLRLVVYRRERLLGFMVDRNAHDSFRSDRYLKRLDRDVIEAAGRQCPEDASFTSYLKRASERLADPSSAGYVLCSPDGDYVSFGWATSMDGYHVEELGIHLEGRRILIFDCYTPVQHRGKRYYTTALHLVVQEHKENKGQLVILCSEQNPASLKGILNAGFKQKFVIDTKLILGRIWKTRLDRDPAQF